MRRGFSFIELILILVIIGGIAAIVIPPRTPREKAEAKSRAMHQQLRILQGHLDDYKARNGTYPTLAQMTANPTKSIEKNGWGALIDGEYTSLATQNPLAPEADQYRISATGGIGYGWEYDETTGRLGATYYDEKTEKVTPDTP